MKKIINKILDIYLNLIDINSFGFLLCFYTAIFTLTTILTLSNQTFISSFSLCFFLPYFLSTLHSFYIKFYKDNKEINVQKNKNYQPQRLINDIKPSLKELLKEARD